MQKSLPNVLHQQFFVGSSGPIAFYAYFSAEAHYYRIRFRGFFLPLLMVLICYSGFNDYVQTRMNNLSLGLG